MRQFFVEKNYNTNEFHSKLPMFRCDPLNESKGTSQEYCLKLWKERLILKTSCSATIAIGKYLAHEVTFKEDK